jgi:hypothetical protein
MRRRCCGLTRHPERPQPLPGSRSALWRGSWRRGGGSDEPGVFSVRRRTWGLRVVQSRIRLAGIALFYLITIAGALKDIRDKRSE